MNKYKDNKNQGSTLLTVIVCLAFIGILGTMMVSATMTNLQMKIVESNSKKNFYSCEMAMEEIRVGLQELTAGAIKTVYQEDVLPNYAAYNVKTKEVRNKDIQNAVLTRMLSSLGPDLNSVLTGFLSSRGASETLNLVVGTLTSTEATETTSAWLKITDIKITYLNQGYQTSISSDINITIPKFTFDQVIDPVDTPSEQPFQDYVLIADGKIVSNNDTGINTIEGSIYAGTEGINVNDPAYNGGHEVHIKGDNIVTRGNITVSDTASLILGDTTMPVKPIIWADNLVTRTSPAYENSGSSIKTTLNSNGINIIKDDLTLEGRNSDVQLTGAYLGYTGLNNAKSSAVMINGAGSSLNLSGLESLILAGRAHVSVERIIGDADNTDTLDIMTGESIAFKSNQKAYLLPGKFISNILHNPVTEADIINYGLPDIRINSEVGDIDYNLFLASPPLNPYKIAAKQIGTPGGTASTLRYYYLNFGGGKQADQYLKTYYEKDSTQLNLMAPFSIGTVSLPSTGTACVGNMMSYNGVSVNLETGLSLSYPDDRSLDEYIANLELNSGVFSGKLSGTKVNQLEGFYSKMIHRLSLADERPFNELDQVVASSINAGGVGEIYDDVINSYTLSTEDYVLSKGFPVAVDITKKYIIVAKGDLTIDQNISGIIFATGNITITPGVTVNGMILSTGEFVDGLGASHGNIFVGDGVTLNGQLVASKDIMLGTGCNLTNNVVGSGIIEDAFLKEGKILSRILINPNTTIEFDITAQTNMVNISISNMITYENWRKN